MGENVVEDKTKRGRWWTRNLQWKGEFEYFDYTTPVTSQTYQGRIRVIGLTSNRRMLTVILAPTDEPGIYYPVTARPADREERRQYREQRGIH
jgi:uncharacterized DUF497 family protein